MDHKKYGSLEEAREPIKKLAKADLEQAKEKIGGNEIQFDTNSVTFFIKRNYRELEIKAVWYNFSRENLSFTELADEFHELDEIENTLLNLLKNTQFEPNKDDKLYPRILHEEEVTFLLTIHN